MSIETVLYRPARVRYAANGALFALFLIFVNSVSGQADEMAYSGTLALWLNRVLADTLIVTFFTACSYAIGSYKDRNVPGPTVRVATFPVRQRWACYGAIAGFLMAMTQFVDLSGDPNLGSGVESTVAQTAVSPFISMVIFALIFYVVGRVRDLYSGQI